MENPNQPRRAPIDMSPEQFRELGYRLVDRIVEHMAAMPAGPVTPGETPKSVREVLGDGPLPARGMDPQSLLDETTRLLFEHSLFIGHPRFLGFITSSPAPIGALGDLLAAAVNPNVGAWVLAPIATEIEAQTVRWIAEMIGYPPDCGGLMVSGGNMANFVGFLAARGVKAGWDVRANGILGGEGRRLRVYVSAETHTWIQKACDLFGLGTGAIRWVPTDE
ncbi:MAG: pyridoxal phosphate-dependent decarboxylase family protein, partial [Chloroflexia bacterium]